MGGGGVQKEVLPFIATQDLIKLICFIIKGIFSFFIWYQTHDDISMHDWKEQFELIHVVKLDLRRIMVLSWYDQVQTS